MESRAMEGTEEERPAWDADVGAPRPVTSGMSTSRHARPRSRLADASAVVASALTPSSESVAHGLSSWSAA
eukprot:2507953-Rhodomonas_salina.1